MQGNVSKLKEQITQAYEQADYAIIILKNNIEISRRK